jgi:hypothetical protein
MFTKNDLYKLCVNKNIKTQSNTIDTVSEVMLNDVLHKAKLGKVSSTKTFPHFIIEYKKEIVEKLTTIFPDSIIEINEDDYYPKNVNIYINWGL